MTGRTMRWPGRRQPAPGTNGGLSRSPLGYMKKLIADARAIINEYNELAEQLGYEETLAVESHSINRADAHWAGISLRH